MFFNLVDNNNVLAKREDIVHVEKVLEGSLFFLSVYREIKILLLGKQDNRVVLIRRISINADWNPQIEILNEEMDSTEIPGLKQVCVSNTVQTYYTESEGLSFENIIVSINNESNKAIGFLIFTAETDKQKNRDFFVEKIRDRGFTSILDRFYSRLIPDALLFIDPYGVISELNHIALEINSMAEDKSIFEYLGEKYAKEFNLSDIIEKGNCFCSCFTIKYSELDVVFIPFYVDTRLEGFLTVISDMTLIRKKDKELIGKSAVIKEIHHRVKNNLQTIVSLLRLQLRRSNSTQLKKAFNESINRISSIALIHEALSREGLDRVSLKLAIKSILEMILTTMVEPNKTIKGEIKGCDLLLNSTQASNVSLCITELIQNAVEHAFVFRNKGNIVITIGVIGNEASVVVEDDGIGLNYKKARNNSLGLQIIELITTENLKGTFRVEGHTYGSRSEIRFQVQEER